MRATHAMHAGLLTALRTAVAAAAQDADEAAREGGVEQVHVCVAFGVGVPAEIGRASCRERV